MMRNKQMNRVLVISALLVVMMLVLPGIALAQEEHGGSDSPLTPLGINAGLLFTHVFNFLLIMVILRLVVWKPLVNMLDTRGEKIKRGLEDASAAARARQNAEAEAEKIMTSARADAAKMLEEARGRGDEVAKTIETAANAEADKIKADAQTETVALRNAELAGLRDQVLSISSAMAGRILGETIDAKKQSALVSDFFSQIPADAKGLTGNVEVVSAMPLSSDEQARVKKEVGGDNISFVVNPAILGGLVIRAQGREIDGSVRSNLSELSGRLT